MGKTHLFGLEKTELLTLLEERSLPKWRGDQLWSWVHQHGVSSFDAMLNLPKSLREDLSLGFTLERPKIINHSLSSDGTEKWAVAFEDEESVEMVLIPEGERQTLCVSSQVGCPVHCAFCCTGTQGFTRNLTSHEIVGQVFLARDVLNDRGHTNVKRSLTNIVMMGMENLSTTTRMSQKLCELSWILRGWPSRRGASLCRLPVLCPLSSAVDRNWVLIWLFPFTPPMTKFASVSCLSISSTTSNHCSRRVVPTQAFTKLAR